METKVNRPHRKRVEMVSLVDAWKASGLSQDIFCKDQQIPYNVFQYWYRKFKQESNQTENGFVEIQTKTSKTFSASCEIIFPSGAKLQMGNVDSEFIRSLVF